MPLSVFCLQIFIVLVFILADFTKKKCMFFTFCLDFTACNVVALTRFAVAVLFCSVYVANDA